MMFYPNGYMNMDQSGEYTKHYYADALRIASKIGSGFSQNLCDEANQIGDDIDPNYLEDRRDKQYDEMMEELTELINGNQITDINPIPYPEANLCNLSGSGIETALFFYHPDHLGSTGMVTNNSSNITQGMLYAPFGEIISDYSPAFHDSPMPNYAFNAKELDEENNMYYYSARYYAPPTFISRDPMFEKYPSISPYTYTNNNPVKYIDPDGQEPVDPDDPPKGKPNNGQKDPPPAPKIEIVNTAPQDNTRVQKNIPVQGTSQGTPKEAPEKTWGQKLDDFINSLTGGIWGTADNGQGQETRKGDESAKKTDLSPLTGSIPDYSGDGSGNQSQSTQKPEPKKVRDGTVFEYRVIRQNDTIRTTSWSKNGDSAKRDKELRNWNIIIYDTAYPVYKTNP
jgi:RHS repeat-associated protein